MPAAVGIALSLWTTALAQPPEGAGGEYRQAYIVLQEALKLTYENRKEEALERYEEAREKLLGLRVKFPDMNREMIEARIAKCDEAIGKLKEEIATPPPPAEPAHAVAETEEAAPEYAPPPQPAAGDAGRESEKLKKEVDALIDKLKAANTGIEKSEAEKAAIRKELEKALAEMERIRREAQSLNTSLGMAIADLDKEREDKAKSREKSREEKAKIEEEAMEAQQASEEILKEQLARALAEKKKVEEEAMEAYRASEEIMRDQMEKQKKEFDRTLEAERARSIAEKKTTAQPVEKLRDEINAYLRQVEEASKELNESLKMIDASQETHRKLLEANRALEKRIASISRTVEETETEAELTGLRETAAAEEEKLKKPDITRGPSPSKKEPPPEEQVLAGTISEKNDEYGKVFIDFVREIREGEELVVIRDNETIATLKVSKVFPSIKGGIASVVPREDAYGLRKKDKVFAAGRGPANPL